MEGGEDGLREMKRQPDCLKEARENVAQLVRLIGRMVFGSRSKCRRCIFHLNLYLQPWAFERCLIRKLTR